MREERTDRLPLTVDKGVFRRILAADTVEAAASIVASFPRDVAVSIIDNLDPLTAAFLVTVFRCRVHGGFSSPSICTTAYAESLCSRAKELRIRGTQGLCHARDQVYRDTGFFAGI